MSFAHAASHVTNCSHLLLAAECLWNETSGKSLKQVAEEQVRDSEDIGREGAGWGREKRRYLKCHWSSQSVPLTNGRAVQRRGGVCFSSGVITTATSNKEGSVDADGWAEIILCTHRLLSLNLYPMRILPFGGCRNQRNSKIIQE